MKQIRNIFQFYVHSSMHVGLAVVSLFAVTSFQFEIALDPLLYFCGFAATVLGYNTIKYDWVRKGKYFFLPTRYPILVWSLIIFLCLAFLFLSWPQKGFFLAISLMVFFYAYPFRKGKVNLRNQRKIKIYWVALVWALFTVCFPIVDQTVDLIFAISVFAHRFVFILCATLPFEIRDLKTDAVELRTWPQRFGVLKTKILGTVGILLSVLLSLAAQWQPIEITLCVHILLWFGLLRASSSQNAYYSSFWMEGIPISWLLLSWLIKH